jgi:predicted amidohydrolase YtcJ
MNGSVRSALTRSGLVGGALLLASLDAVAQVAPADLILTNANVYTVDEAHPRAQAVAVRGGEIVFVGSAAEAETLRGSGTRVLDLEGMTVVPGMIDSHGHFPGLGTALRTVDLVGTRSLEEVVERVVARVGQTGQGEWILGRGWDQNEWADTRFPHHSALSEAVPDHPVVLTRVDGHAVFANAAAMERAGITDDTPDPPGGRIVRDPATGQAIGVFVDRAMDAVREVIPAESRAQIREGLLLAQRELNRVGLTAVHDAGSPAEVMGLYEEMARAGELTVRTHAMIREDLDGLRPFFERGPRYDVDGSHFLNIGAIKVSVDGALGSRGAALLEDYSDEPGNDGLLFPVADDLPEIARRALETGFQLNVHAIGDRANRVVLDTFEEALRGVPAADHRFRVEHAQILHRHDILRFAELGIIPSMQAIHQASDMAWAWNRLGYTRLLGAYAWRSLLESGVVIPGGSDFPVEPADPLLSFHAAVTRQNADHWPSGGWFPEQVMSRDEALRHMTVWGAYAAFMEDVTGSLTPGKLADIVVFDRDIMTVPTDEILEAQVVFTIVHGRVVYDREREERRTATDAPPEASPDLR